MSAPPVAELLTDLEDERADLASLLTGLGVSDWSRQTPAEGWDIGDQVRHLTYYDDIAALAIEDAATFAEVREGAWHDPACFERDVQGAGPEAGLPALMGWRTAGERFDRAAAAADPKARVPWFGPDMSLRSLVTARLMETWAHGQDVYDALGVIPTPTDRIRHVVVLAVRARAYGFAVRNLPSPETSVRVELLLPSGATWSDGPHDAVESVSGGAVEFALALVRRRHVDDTSLKIRGKAARQWMTLGQAYAGPPGPAPHRQTQRTGG